MRIALGVEYDGSAFCGWQSQKAVPTVQDAVEAALSQIAARPIRVHCAGRTDAGVHATGQVIHFDSEVGRPLTAWVRGCNACLPKTVVIRWAREVPEGFHARFSAEARHYRYVLLNRPERPAVLVGKVGWYHRALDTTAMQLASRLLLGEHDFSAFRDAQCQAKSPIKTLYQLDLAREGDCLLFDFHANAFLHHMVRNIVGALVAVGSGQKPTSWIADLLAERNRRFAAPTFAPDGLYLTAVDYSADWGLPQQQAGIIALPSI